MAGTVRGPAEGARTTARRVLLCRLAGLVAGLVAGLAVARGPGSWLGLGPALAAPTFAGCLLAGVIVGETGTRKPAGRTRTAALEVRQVRSYLPVAMTRALVVTIVALTGFLAVTSVVAGPDDQGRHGRSLTLSCADYTTTVSPWPGGYYSVPIGLSVLGGLLVSAAAARALTRRRRPDGDRVADDRLRRSSARAVTAACGVLAAVPLAGTAIVAAGQLRALSAQSCAPPWLPAAGWASLVLGAVALLAAGYYAAALLLPHRRPAS
jgi:hypothetical protein